MSTATTYPVDARSTADAAERPEHGTSFVSWFEALCCPEPSRPADDWVAECFLDAADDEPNRELAHA